MNKLCFECGKPANIKHHVIPESKGGTKTVPLCNQCHSLVHDAKLVSLTHLIKNGQEKVRQLREDKTIVEMYNDGASKRSIAQKFSIRRQTVYNILQENGLHQNVGAGCGIKINDEIIDCIKKLRQEGMSWQQIEIELDISHVHLFRIVRQYGLKGRYNSNLKKRQSYKTLTDELKQKAITLREQGQSWKQIANELGVARETFYKHKLHKETKN